MRAPADEPSYETQCGLVMRFSSPIEGPPEILDSFQKEME